MNVPLIGRAALVCALASSSAALAEAAKPTPPAASVPAGAPNSAAPAPSGISESKYLSLLYAEIAKHTPEDNAAGPGEVTASFVVGASGKVEKVTIGKTTSPAHAEVVQKILAEVVVPPPPGGSLDIGQTFKFH
jgi:outer membrane biosynthesis protein TonB